MNKMKVILLQDVKKLGTKGQIVEVSEGYGRNFLLPRKLAAPGTAENINDAKQKQAAAKHKKIVASEEAVVLASQLKKVELTIPVKVGEGGKIFGAITGKTISDAAKEQYDLELDKKKVEIKEPIKTLGDHEILIRVHPEITSVIKIHVVEG
jgi:large subunit ribosomal protein L9